MAVTIFCGKSGHTFNETGMAESKPSANAALMMVFEPKNTVRFGFRHAAPSFKSPLVNLMPANDGMSRSARSQNRGIDTVTQFEMHLKVSVAGTTLDTHDQWEPTLDASEGWKMIVE